MKNKLFVLNVKEQSGENSTEYEHTVWARNERSALIQGVAELMSFPNEPKSRRKALEFLREATGKNDFTFADYWNSDETDFWDYFSERMYRIKGINEANPQLARVERVIRREYAGSEQAFLEEVEKYKRAKNL